MSIIESMIGKQAEYILMNNELPTEEQLNQYVLQEGEQVLVENDMAEDTRIITQPLLSYEAAQFSKTDALQHTRSFIRHDSYKLAKAIYEIL